MNNFLLAVPLWLLMVLVAGTLTGVAVGLQALIRRYVPAIQTARHNDVAGFLAAVIGVIYAVTVGFIIAQQWEDFTVAKDRTYREAFNLAAVVEGSAVLGPQSQQQFAEAVVAYNRAVIAWWPRPDRPHTDADGDAQTLAPLYTLLDQARPATEGQRAFVAEAATRLADVTTDREERLHRARSAHLEWPLWVLIGFASAVVLVFCALFGLESRWLHYTMITGVALAVAGNVLLVLLLNHPLAGPLRVPPDSYASVLADLTR